MRYENVTDMGIWGLNDGNNYAIATANVSARSSVLLQSDLLGRSWRVYNWTTLIKAMPPPPFPPPS